MFKIAMAILPRYNTNMKHLRTGNEVAGYGCPTCWQPQESLDPSDVLATKGDRDHIS